MGKTSPKFEETILLVSQILSGLNYCIRGTASLVLQGYDMNADDIDILCDQASALKCNELLKDYIKTPVEYSESAKYKSYFGQFTINGMLVEVMGNWQIKDPKDQWSKIYTPENRIELDVLENPVFVTPVGLELECFAKMGRWNAFHKLKKLAGITSKEPNNEQTPKVDSKQPSLF